VRHVVGAVAEVGQPQPGQGRRAAPALGQGLQVGQHLAGVEVVGQRVDDRHRGGGGHRGQPLLGEGAPHHRVDVAGQHHPGVLQGLLPPQLGAAPVDDDGVPAELGDAHLEGEPGAGGVLLEDHRHPARALQRPPGKRGGLELGGQRQHLGLLGRVQVVVAQEVPGAHAVSPAAVCAAVRIAGRSARKASTCAAVMISGGASRTTFGAVALTR
jgi:hypothetical protein